MNREMVIDRLEMLVSKIEETVETWPIKECLFNEHLIKTSEDIKYLRKNINGENPHYDKDLEQEFILDIMNGANRLWKHYKKILGGEFSTIEVIELETQVTTFLDEGSVIQAIKYYREWMIEHGTGVTLREAKNKIDSYNAARKGVSLI
tara:strand:- start:737 stop:1183 length:447 start_codon:yes stop_codon:yes gene_type:complete